ncbi:MAG: hypothetical protein J4G14_00445 [Dehalococcoidia bacterium]|nr:hypothetical protein [Dehalococcoidia bacterium]
MARRTRLTRPYPVSTLEEVIPIAETIQNASGGHPVPTELLAESLGTTLKSSAFVQRLGSSSKYGITLGSHTSEQISLTPLGESLTAPRDTAERSDALRTAAREPDIFRKFYDIHSGKPLPEIPYASNTLVREMGVNQELTEECLRIIRANGLLAGIVTERSGSLVVEGLDVAPENYGPDGTQDTGECESDAFEGRERGEASYVLVLSVDDDPVAQEIEGLIGTLSIPVRAAEIGLQVSQVISPGISTKLRSARGCILVWPSPELTGGDQKVLTRTWMTLGAASFQLGDRLVIVADVQDGSELAMITDEADITVVDRSADGSLFSELMSAMVGTSIIQVSMG